MDYKRKDIEDSVNRVNNFIKNNRKNPNWIRVCSDRLSVNEYNKLDEIKDAINRINKFIKNNNDYPNYVTILEVKMNKSEYSILFQGLLNQPKKTIYRGTKYLTTTTAGIGQDTPYYCACNSMQQAIYHLTGLTVNETNLARIGGTTTAGTSHSGIDSMAKAYNLKVTWYNFSDIGWEKLGQYLERQDVAVFWHELYRNQWGHYSLCNEIDVKTHTLKILNSLGTKRDNSRYNGYIETRSFSTQENYWKGISQKSIAIVERR